MRKLINRLLRQEWRIAFLGPDSLSGYVNNEWHINYIKHNYKDRWFADPFILDVTDDAVIVLVEMLLYKENRGKLAKLTISRDTNELIELKVILDLSTHLSFPSIIRTSEGIYIYPENSASGKSVVYKYDESEDRLVPFVEVANSPLTDAIVTDLFGGNYLFTTKLPDPNGCTVEIYKSESDVFGPYRKFQEITFADKTARSAGNFFKIGERVIRPVQNNNVYYGGGIAFQEVSLLDGKFTIKEISRKELPEGYNGMHTFNQYKGYTIIDCRRCVNPTLYSIAKRIKTLLTKKSC